MEGRADERTEEGSRPALDVVLAEFGFVSGLIPLYRGVETTALGGTGLVVSGIVAALAALESAETPKTAAEGVLLSAGAWAPVVLLLIEIMALTRVARASAYIADHLHPLACRLTGNPEVLKWELGPTTRLLRRVEPQPAKGDFKMRAVRLAASSTPLIITIALVAIVLAVSGAIIYPTALTIVSGVLAIGAAFAGAAYGISFTARHEARDTEAAEPEQDDVRDSAGP